MDSAGGVIYQQIRIGKNGKPFTCYKFRSMVTDADDLRDTLVALNEATGPLFKVRNDPRQRVLAASCAAIASMNYRSFTMLYAVR